MNELQEYSLNKDKIVADELKKLKEDLHKRRKEELGLQGELAFATSEHEKKIQNLAEQKNSLNMEKLDLESKQNHLSQELKTYEGHFKTFRQAFLIHMTVFTNPEWSSYFGKSNFNDLEKCHALTSTFLNAKITNSASKISKLDKKIEENENQVKEEHESFSVLKSKTEKLIKEKGEEIHEAKEDMFNEELEKLAMLELQNLTVEEILK